MAQEHDYLNSADLPFEVDEYGTFSELKSVAIKAVRKIGDSEEKLEKFQKILRVLSKHATAKAARVRKERDEFVALSTQQDERAAAENDKRIELEIKAAEKRLAYLKDAKAVK